MRIEANAALSNITGLCGATVNGEVEIRLSDLTFVNLGYCEYESLATKAHLLTAINTYIANEANAEIKYGQIATWDVSKITDMSRLFEYKSTFNADIGSWSVGRVTNMDVRRAM